MYRLGALLVICFSIIFESAAIQPSVTLQDGTVILGVRKSVDSDILGVSKDIEVYYGIPYAEAPVGPLRFKPPLPFKAIGNPYNATEIEHACLQPPSDHSYSPKSNKMSEDCLFLDVFVPKGLTDKTPVLVWIHGGAFIYGAGQMIVSESLPLVAYGEIIVVTLNYRLGALGFLSTGDDLIPGNLGLRDQQAALRWVNENIEAFGGDPSQITIIGESAGSVGVACQILSPSSRGLFKYAIMESGSPFDPWVNSFPPEYHRQEVKALAKLVDCSPEDIENDGNLLRCLQKAPAKDINMNLVLAQKELGVPHLLPVSPVTNDDFLPKDPQTLLEDGGINVKSIIVGTNAEEGTFQTFSYFFPNPDDQPYVNASMFRAVMNFIGIEDPVLHEVVRTIYMPDASDLENESHDYFTEATQILGDYFFLCGETKFSKLASSSSANVYRYTMTFRPSNNFLGIKWAGASHADELQYVFGAPFGERFLSKTTDDERELSQKTMDYWINFMHSGDPNVPASSTKLPDWPKFTATDNVFKDLSPTMRDNIYMKQKECHFLEHILPPLKEALDRLNTFRKETNTSPQEKGETNTSPQENGECESGHCHLDKSEP